MGKMKSQRSKLKLGIWSKEFASYGSLRETTAYISMGKSYLFCSIQCCLLYYADFLQLSPSEDRTSAMFSAVYKTRSQAICATYLSKGRGFSDLGGVSLQLFLRGGSHVGSNPVKKETSSSLSWGNVQPDRRKEFARLAQEMDGWLRRERGISLKNANRALIADCMHHLGQAHEQAVSPSPVPNATAAATSGGIANNRALTVDELNERMWLACQLGDDDIVRQAVADGAEVPLSS
jgi:hypothetical protein